MRASTREALRLQRNPNGSRVIADLWSAADRLAIDRCWGSVYVDFDGPDGLVGVWFEPFDAPEDADLIGAAAAESEALEEAIATMCSWPARLRVRMPLRD